MSENSSVFEQILRKLGMWQSCSKFSKRFRENSFIFLENKTSNLLRVDEYNFIVIGRDGFFQEKSFMLFRSKCTFSRVDF